MHDRPLFRRAAWMAVAAVLAWTTAQAQIPESINYQGRLKQNNQLANGTFQFTFRLYDGLGGGATLLWTEVHPAVTVTDGQFEVELGTITTFDSAGLTFEQQYFLGMEVDNDGEMTPRKPFTSVGYALNAVHAQNADHSDNSDHANDSDHSNNSDHANDSDHSNNSDHANDSDHSNNSDRSSRSDFAEGVKEDRLALVMVGLRGGGTPAPGSAIYTDPLAAMSDIGTWCGTPGPTHTCLLRILPGTYGLGASDLVGQAYVDIEGSGPGVTILTTGAQVRVGSDVELRGLTVEKQGGSGAAVLADGSARLRDLDVEVASTVDESAILCSGGQPALANVRAEGRGQGALRIASASSPTLHDTRVLADASLNDTVGLVIEGSAPTLTNVRVTVTAPGTFDVTGVLVDLGAEPVLRDVIVTATSQGTAGVWGVRVDNGSDVDMESVRVEGLVEGSGTFVQGMSNKSSTVRLVDATVQVTDSLGFSTNTVGVWNDSSNVELVGLTVRTESPSSSTGIQNTGTSTVRIDRSVVISDSTAIMNNSASACFVAFTKLDGTVQGMASNYTCVGAYDGAYAELTGQCQ